MAIFFGFLSSATSTVNSSGQSGQSNSPIGLEIGS
jgi:hypothetical protein